MAPPSSKFATNYSVLDPFSAPSTCEVERSDERDILAYVRELIEFYRGNSAAPVEHKCSSSSPYPVHVAYRYGGTFHGEGIACGHSLSENLRRAVCRAVNLERLSKGNVPTSFGTHVYIVGSASGFSEIGVQDVAAEAPAYSSSLPIPKANLGIEVTLFYEPALITAQSLVSGTAEFDRGVHGIAAVLEMRTTLFSSSKCIIHNYSPKALLQRLTESVPTSQEAISGADTKLYRLSTRHIVSYDSNESTRSLFRCDRMISLEEVTATRLQSFISSTGKWLANNVRKDGRLEYKYMPSRGAYSKNNNMIRQWMGTHALAELWQHTGEENYKKTLHRNVGYNLRNFFREEQDFGYIYYNGKAKLGAAACALMALARCPEDQSFNNVIKRLQSLMLRLHQEDGSFRTFLIPEERNDNQSFYSGEALLALAMTDGRGMPIDTWSIVGAGRRYYMPYYRQTLRYTPFIPWHTMAYWHAYQATKDTEYAEAIFEMNDWLICIQDIDDCETPDIAGRFYRYEHAFNGPPHSSSTAVYVEGLAYAYDLAKSFGHKSRCEAYIDSIRYGLRSLFQLQYRTENSFYLTKKDRVLGGIRTTVTDNQIRCDNTQHTIMASLAVQRFLSSDELTTDLPSARAFRNEVRSRFGRNDGEDPKNSNVSDGQSTTNVLLGGDVQLGRYTETWAEKYGHEYAFRGITHLLRNADVFVTNLECVVAQCGDKVSKRGTKAWHLRASPHMLKVFPSTTENIVTVANNHSMDYGQDALLEMLNSHLSESGIQYAGAGENSNRAREPAIYNRNGNSIGVCSVTTIEGEFGATEHRPGYNWINLENPAEYGRQLHDLVRRVDGLACRALAVHWGRNHDESVTLRQKTFAHAAVDAGFDLIIGHHAHVVRGIEVYNGAPIFYDLGNLLVDFKFQGNDSSSILVRVVLRGRGIETIELIPVSLHDKTVNIATGIAAKAILNRVRLLSAPFNTTIHDIKGSAFLRLDTES